MNWYKIAQESIKTPKEMDMSYYDIGHCDPNFEICVDKKHKVKDAKIYLWWWENGDVKYETIDPEGERTHMDILGGDTLKFYQGRVQISPDKTIVSIAVPNGQVYRPIPEQLIEALQREFGHNIQMVRFD